VIEKEERDGNRRRIARLTCSAKAIRLLCSKNPFRILVSGSVYANSAPTSFISCRYTARTSGGSFFASECNPCAAVKACVRVTDEDEDEPFVGVGVVVVVVVVDMCMDEVSEEIEDDGEDGEDGAS